MVGRGQEGAELPTPLGTASGELGYSEHGEDLWILNTHCLLGANLEVFHTVFPRSDAALK